MEEEEEEEEEEEPNRNPLQNQKFFGAGLKRKRIQFVPAAAVKNEPTAAPKISSSSSSSSSNAGDRYLSIVLPRKGQQIAQTDNNNISHNDTAQSASQPSATPEENPTCEICHLPLHSTADSQLPAAPPKPHETSLVHQFCLSHSTPPSHLDRSRAGLKYLSSYGWDPDSRRGLGVNGEGIRVPLKPRIKNDTVGLGMDVALKKKGIVLEKKKRVERLDAKGVRKKDAEERKRRERLQELFYQSEDLEKYLAD
ncbi:MAG: hypothetical protein Q9191_001979 [Dirinaria sp. TL-2023a]